jgi:hypothetical protein
MASHSAVQILNAKPFSSADPEWLPFSIPFSSADPEWLPFSIERQYLLFTQPFLCYLTSTLNLMFFLSQF